MKQYIFFLNRHIELEAELKKEEKIHNLKKNLKLLMIALIVLAIEKLSEFITALISSRASGEIEVLKFVINIILLCPKKTKSQQTLKSNKDIESAIRP